MRKSHKRNILFNFLKYILNPFVFISLLGPSLIEHNLILVNYAGYENQVNPTFKALLNNEYNYAFTSYNIQLFVLILAVFFLIAETFTLLFKLQLKSGGWDDFKNLFEESYWLSFLAILFIILILALTTCYLYGLFASPNIVNLYLKENEISPLKFIKINTPIPPPNSPITIFRLCIIIYGIIFSNAIKNTEIRK
jgi:hypothetical protein